MASKKSVNAFYLPVHEQLELIPDWVNHCPADIVCSVTYFSFVAVEFVHSSCAQGFGFVATPNVDYCAIGRANSPIH